VFSRSHNKATFNNQFKHKKELQSMQHVLLISEEAAQALFDGMIPVAFPQALGFRGLVGLHSPNGTPMTPSKEQTLAFKVSRWLADCDIETGNGLSAFVSEMHASFTKWCNESDESPVGVRPFMRHIHSLGFIPRRTPNGLVFTGIGFPKHDDEDADDQADGDPEDKAIIAFFRQWLNQMEKLPGHTVNEDKLYMCYHRYCVYYHEVPMTLTGFRAAMATTGAPPEDVPFVNADLKEYIGIKVPVQFMFRMYGEMPF
jgi:hypothetical protein